jgi:hypothetical protein
VVRGDRVARTDAAHWYELHTEERRGDAEEGGGGSWGGGGGSAAVLLYFGTSYTNIHSCRLSIFALLLFLYFHLSSSSPVFSFSTAATVTAVTNLTVLVLDATKWDRFVQLAPQALESLQVMSGFIWFNGIRYYEMPPKSCEMVTGK